MAKKADPKSLHHIVKKLKKAKSDVISHKRKHKGLTKEGRIVLDLRIEKLTEAIQVVSAACAGSRRPLNVIFLAEKFYSGKRK